MQIDFLLIMRISAISKMTSDNADDNTNNNANNNSNSQVESPIPPTPPTPLLPPLNWSDVFGDNAPSPPLPTVQIVWCALGPNTGNNTQTPSN